LANLFRIPYLPGSVFGPFSLYLTDMTGRSPLRKRRTAVACGTMKEKEEEEGRKSKKKEKRWRRRKKKNLS